MQFGGVPTAQHELAVVQVSMAGDMATWLVAHSQMHPAFSDSAVMYGMNMGGYDDPTTRNTASRFEHLILQLQTAAYDQAKRLIRQRKAAIEQLAQELTDDPQETVQGHRIVAIIENTPVAEPELLPSNGAWSEGQQPTAETEVRSALTGGCGFVKIIGNALFIRWQCCQALGYGHVLSNLQMQNFSCKVLSMWCCCPSTCHTRPHQSLEAHPRLEPAGCIFNAPQPRCLPHSMGSHIVRCRHRQQIIDGTSCV